MRLPVMRKKALLSAFAAAILLGFGCTRDPIVPAKSPVQAKPTMVHPVVTFTNEEAQLMRELGIAVFRNKLILKAQPPITADQLAEVQAKVDGQISPDLIALWQTSFGGDLDYDYEIVFGEHLYAASFRELFYPGSKTYHDLDGWIDHELEMEEEAAEAQGKPAPERTQYLPFGGFEYLERFYVSHRSDEYGAILFYARGIPWKGRLNEDSIAKVASSVAELFDQIVLNEDPFDEKSSEYASGKDMLERIEEIGADHPHLAEKLKQVVRHSIVDWRATLERADFNKPLTKEESRAVRLALVFAADRNDVGLIDQMHKRRAPFDLKLHGNSGVLSHAMSQKSFAVIARLLELDVQLEKAPLLFVSECSDDLLLKLIAHGVRFDPEAIYSAAETGAIESAIALVNSSQVIERDPVAEIVAIARERADKHDVDAGKVERKELGSYLTPEQYRQRGVKLREFAKRLESTE